MAKLTLNNGDVLHVRLESRENGEVEILCADTAKQLKHDPWYLATLQTDGSLYPVPALQGCIKTRLQYSKKTGAIKIAK